MKAKLTTKIKKIASELLPNSERMRYLLWLPKLHNFHKTYGLQGTIVNNRRELYSQINSDINNIAIDYYEFGVFKGSSIKYWSNINTNRNSNFYGFDTFNGLPENWDNFTGGLKKGTFDTNGRVPETDDNRIYFYKGLFQDTLPEFLKSYNSNNTLVINIDADLYSSTLFVLTQMHDILKKGTIVIFDEFSSVLHEFRAFEDYCSAYNVDFELLVRSNNSKSYYAHVAIKIL